MGASLAKKAKKRDGLDQTMQELVWISSSSIMMMIDEKERDPQRERKQIKRECSFYLKKYMMRALKN
jgi:hypothetical protein